jgi:hypothetical protein
VRVTADDWYHIYGSTIRRHKTPQTLFKVCTTVPYSNQSATAQ